MNHSLFYAFRPLLILVLWVLLSGGASPAWAKWPSFRLLPVRREGEAPPERPCPQCNLDHLARFHYAGHPEQVAWSAKPSETPAYGGYYVGGGAPFFGRGRGPHEGTFGWDYFGNQFHRHVQLKWLSPGRQYRERVQGYETDGPHILGKE